VLLRAFACQRRAERPLLCAVASRGQSLDFSDRGGGGCDGIRQILPELLKVLGGHSHDHLLVRSDVGGYRLSPGEHLAGFLERGVRHDVTLVPGVSARNRPSGRLTPKVSPVAACSTLVTMDRHRHLFPRLDEQIADGLEELRRPAEVPR
jgi:hypothetical protein